MRLCVLLYRNHILQDIDRFIHPEQVINRVVYCLDDLISNESSIYTSDSLQLGNFDEQKLVHCTSMKYIIEQQTVLFYRRILRGSNVVLRS